MNKRTDWIGLDLHEMDEIIDGNTEIEELSSAEKLLLQSELREVLYAVIIDTMTTLMEKNGFEEDEDEKPT